MWSAVLEEWLFWVRDEERRRKALERGIDAWRVWTLLELTGVVGFQAQDLRNIAASAASSTALCSLVQYRRNGAKPSISWNRP